MSVINADCPSLRGRCAVSDAKSKPDTSPLKRSRISHGRSLWPSIKGVRAVVDTTTVASSTRTDDQIKGDLARALEQGKSEFEGKDNSLYEGKNTPQ